MTEELNGGCLDERAIRDALAAGPTPGPWQQAHRRDDDGWFNTEVFDASGEAIARLTWYPKQMGNGVTTTYREPNARLIAACNPVAITALLAELDTLRASLSTSKQAGEEPLPEGWNLVEKKTCYVLQDGNSVVATLAGPDAEENASILARALYTPPAVMPAAPSDAVREQLVNWAAERWTAEVKNRPMVNVHRRSLDDTWRQVLRHLGVDDRARLGPTHDELRAEIGSKEWEAMNGRGKS